MLTVTQRRDLTQSCTMRNFALHGGLLESAASGIAACAQIAASPAHAVDCQNSQNEATQAMQALSRGAANDSRDRWCKHMNCLQAAQWVHAHADAELACAWAHGLTPCSQSGLFCIPTDTLRSLTPKYHSPLSSIGHKVDTVSGPFAVLVPTICRLPTNSSYSY